MKSKLKTTIILLFVFSILSVTSYAQNRTYSEKYGGTFNLGVGIGGYYGYYHYVDSYLPVLHFDYEFDVLRSFTLAPFATFYTYRNESAHYRETIIPIGVKGTIYLDRILHANSNWDFYIAGSLGFGLVKSSWDDGYSGVTLYHDVSPLFLDFHVGTEYHLSDHLGLFLDFSTGVSTLGLAFH